MYRTREKIMQNTMAGTIDTAISAKHMGRFESRKCKGASSTQDLMLHSVLFSKVGALGKIMYQEELNSDIDEGR